MPGAIRVTGGAEDAVVVNRPFTWNPSGPGVKIEDTIQLTGNGLNVLTAQPRWPSAPADGIERPLTLQL